MAQPEQQVVLISIVDAAARAADTTVAVEENS